MRSSCGRHATPPPNAEVIEAFERIPNVNRAADLHAHQLDRQS
jgi:hypothetical protein